MSQSIECTFLQKIPWIPEIRICDHMPGLVSKDECGMNTVAALCICRKDAELCELLHESYKGSLK